MIQRSVAGLFIVGLAAVVLGGCSTPQSRIEENMALFASFPPEVQETVRRGDVEVGYTKDMAYLALGRPDRRYTRATEGEGVVEEVWFYEGTHYRSVPLWHGGLHGFHHFHHHEDGLHFGHIGPEWVRVPEEYVRVRLEFEGDRIVGIERVAR